MVAKTLVPDILGRRRLARYERALEAKLFEGTIPVCSDDPEEQDQLDAAHESIAVEYNRARLLLLRHLDERGLEIVELREALSDLMDDVLGTPGGCRGIEAWDFARKVLNR